jgi:hypothetical protein
LFFDYNGNGVQDAKEPAIAGALVQLKDNAGGVIAEAHTDSSGDYTLEDVRTGTYRLYVGVEQFSDKRFRYMCRSAEELTAIPEGYGVVLDRPQSVDIGLMEGFLTLPFQRETKFTISNYYDWDPRKGAIKWWDGTIAVRGDMMPLGPYRNNFDNHTGIDYSMEVGNTIVAPAPGVVRGNNQVGPQGQIGTQIYHDSIDMWTFYNHLSRIDVSEGERVSRGQKIAESGESGTDFAHLHFNTKWVENNDFFALFDPYKPTFAISEESSGSWGVNPSTGDQVWKTYPLKSNLNLLGYWTKEDDPQYATT